MGYKNQVNSNKPFIITPFTTTHPGTTVSALYSHDSMVLEGGFGDPPGDSHTDQPNNPTRRNTPKAKSSRRASHLFPTLTKPFHEPTHPSSSSVLGLGLGSSSNLGATYLTQSHLTPSYLQPRSSASSANVYLPTLTSSGPVPYLPWIPDRACDGPNYSPEPVGSSQPWQSSPIKAVSRGEAGHGDGDGDTQGQELLEGDLNSIAELGQYDGSADHQHPGYQGGDESSSPQKSQDASKAEPHRPTGDRPAVPQSRSVQPSSQAPRPLPLPRLSRKRLIAPSPHPPSSSLYHPYLRKRTLRPSVSSSSTQTPSLFPFSHPRPTPVSLPHPDPHVKSGNALPLDQQIDLISIKLPTSPPPESQIAPVVSGWIPVSQRPIPPKVDLTGGIPVLTYDPSTLVRGGLMGDFAPGFQSGLGPGPVFPQVPVVLPNSTPKASAWDSSRPLLDAPPSMDLVRRLDNRGGYVRRNRSAGREVQGEEGRMASMADASSADLEERYATIYPQWPVAPVSPSSSSYDTL